MIFTTSYFPLQALAAARAILFMDLSSFMLSQLLSEINLAYYYTPKLRSTLSVTVYDITPHPEPFCGEMKHHSDEQGTPFAQYRHGPCFILSENK